MLDAFRDGPVGSLVGGDPIPAKTEAAYDFGRLERAVGALLERYRELLRENRSLRRQLADHERRTHSLEAQVLETNQRRQDVAKRIDDLITQIDHLDAHFGGRRE